MSASIEQRCVLLLSRGALSVEELEGEGDLGDDLDEERAVGLQHQ